MKTLKSIAVVIGLVFVTVGMGLYLLFGTLGLYGWDKLRARFGRGPLARKKVDTVKVYPAVPGLVMDEDGFVEPPCERPMPVLMAVPFGIPSMATVTSMSDRRQSYHDAAPSVHSPGDPDFAQSDVFAFPSSREERDRLRTERLAKVIAGPLPANVVRLTDFRPKGKPDGKR